MFVCLDASILGIIKSAIQSSCLTRNYRMRIFFCNQLKNQIEVNHVDCRVTIKATCVTLIFSNAPYNGCILQQMHKDNYINYVPVL